MWCWNGKSLAVVFNKYYIANCAKQYFKHYANFNLFSSITIVLVKYYPNVIDDWMKYNEVKYCVKAHTISNGTGFEPHQSGSSKSTRNYCTRIYLAELCCLLLVCFLEKIFWNNNSRSGSRALRKGHMNPLSSVLHIFGKNGKTVLIIMQCK